MRFVMRLEDEIELMSRLRERVSGVACPQHVFEMRQTTGKLIVPSDHWDVQLEQVRDFVGQQHDLEDAALQCDLPAVDADELHVFDLK